MRLQLRTRIRGVIVDLRGAYLRRVKGMHISKTARVSWGYLDKVVHKGVFNNDESYLASGVTVLAHDFARLPVDLLQRLASGVSWVLMPLSCQASQLAGAGAVVTKDVPSHCVVAGNPAKSLKKASKRANMDILS